MHKVRRFIVLGALVAVVATVAVPSASAASPTMAQFRALKAQVATLKTKLANTRATANEAAAGVAWYDACLGYFDVSQYDGYDYWSSSYTTALDFSEGGNLFAGFYPECFWGTSARSVEGADAPGRLPDAIEPAEARRHN